MAKCTVSDDFNAVWNRNIRKISALVKSQVFDFSNTIWNFDGTQRGAVRKCVAADGRNGIGECDILKQYTFFENGAAKSFYIAREFDALQFGTIHEHL